MQNQTEQTPIVIQSTPQTQTVSRSQAIADLKRHIEALNEIQEALIEMNNEIKRDFFDKSALSEAPMPNPA